MTERTKEDREVLCTAIEDGSLEIVEDLLKDGADVNTKDGTKAIDGGTLLHNAVFKRQVEMVKLLLKYGANIDIQNHWGMTPLDVAKQNWYSEMVELLIINGAKERDKHPSVIFSAVRKGRLKIVEDLLKDGADVNSTDDSYSIDGKTLLHAAVENRQMKMTELLINYGANINIKSRFGTPPIADALQNNDTNMIELLLANGAEIKESPKVLYVAVECDHLKFVEDLLKVGIDVNWMNDMDYDENMTLLHSVVYNGKVEMTKLLINYGANINIKDKMGRSPLLTATMHWDTKMTRLLLINGAGINEDPKILVSAVMIASWDIDEELVKEGLYVNRLDDTNLNEGMTLLHSTVAWSQIDRAKQLIKFGVDVNAKDDEGNTPVDDAIRIRDIEMIELLLTNGAYIKDDLQQLYANYSEYEDELRSTIELLKEHIVKIKAAGLYVSERNLQWINNNKTNYFLKRCEAEIEIMKIEKIDNSCASFYDILTKNTSELAKNENIVQALRSDDYYKKFPIYASMIDSRFRRGLKRKELLEQVRNKLLPSLSESLNQLPILCTEKIYSYLSTTDLIMILAGCEFFNKYISI